MIVLCLTEEYYLLTNKKDERWRLEYIKASDALQNHLVVRKEAPDILKKNSSYPSETLIWLNTIQSGSYTNNMDTLSCFASGVLGMGGVYLDRPKDLDLAINVIRSCYWIAENSYTVSKDLCIENFEESRSDFFIQ